MNNNKYGYHKFIKSDEQVEFASDFVSSADVHSILIYKGKKYNWQVKNELHIHIIEHLFLDCLEVVGTYFTFCFSKLLICTVCNCMPML